ncbi:hypothetical protein PAEPH01_2673, partial [Pancytospora epiphaga]
LAIITVVSTTVIKEYAPGCPECAKEANLINRTNLLNGEKEAARKKSHGVVFTTDGFTHGDGGILVSVEKTSDMMHDGIPKEDLEIAVGKKSSDVQRAHIIEAEKKLEEIRLEKIIAGEMAHKLELEKNVMEKKLAQEERKKYEKPTIVAKDTIPVIVYPRETFPFFHHYKIMLDNVQRLRDQELDRIRGQQKQARLDDITDMLSNANPGANEPSQYKNLLLPKDNTPGLHQVPVSPHDGSFFIVPNQHNNIIPVPSANKDARVPHTGPLDRAHLPTNRYFSGKSSSFYGVD